MVLAIGVSLRHLLLAANSKAIRDQGTTVISYSVAEISATPQRTNYGFWDRPDPGGRFAPRQPFRIFLGLQRTVMLESSFLRFPLLQHTSDTGDALEC